MSLRFVVVEGTTAAHHDRSVFMLDWAHPSTIRTRLLFTQLAGLLLGRRFQRPRQQTTYGRHADLFHLGQINVQAGALLTPVLADDDFSPALGEFLDSPQIFRDRFPCSHVASVQRDKSINPGEILP
jgi:hypothetical protein